MLGKLCIKNSIKKYASSYYYYFIYNNETDSAMD